MRCGSRGTGTIGVRQESGPIATKGAGRITGKVVGFRWFNSSLARRQPSPGSIQSKAQCSPTQAEAPMGLEETGLISAKASLTLNYQGRRRNSAVSLNHITVPLSQGEQCYSDVDNTRLQVFV